MKRNTTDYSLLFQPGKRMRSRIEIGKMLLASGMVILPFASGKAGKPGTKPKSPNVVFILADDLGIGDLGCYGQSRILTPGIDELAKNGMKFTQHYSGSTVSAPSRCGLLTGKHTGHSYIRGNQGYSAEDGRKYDLNLAAAEVTLGEVFKEKSYITACVGKWGLGGPSGEGHPNNQGFDYFFGYLGQANAHRYYPDQLFENNTPVLLNKKVYSHDLIMEKALDFIDKNADSSFFLYLTPTIPHADLIVPNNELFDYDGKFQETPYPGAGYTAQDKPRATFAAMVSRLDRDVKRVIEMLREKGVLENTIIIFTSDNGTHKEGGHDPDYFDSNGPFRGTKRDLYEGGIRTPFIVQWPEVIAPGSVSYHVSAFWDFMPTVCSLIQAPVPAHADGISYLPTLTGKGKQKQHDYLYYEFHEEGGKQAVIKDRWKLVHLQVNNPQKESYELYNLATDPSEIANVIDLYPKQVKALKKIMQEARNTNNHWKFTFEK